MSDQYHIYSVTKLSEFSEETNSTLQAIAMSEDNAILICETLLGNDSLETLVFMDPYSKTPMIVESEFIPKLGRKETTIRHAQERELPWSLWNHRNVGLYLD